MSKMEEPPKRQRPDSRFGRVPLAILVCLAFIAASFTLHALDVRIEVNVVHGQGKFKPQILQEKKLTCRAPLPTLLTSHPPGPDSPGIQEAADSLHEFLSIRTTASDIDSLSIAVVTPAGPIFERGYGVLRANETSLEKRGSVTRDSIYRIASITKMFAKDSASAKSPITLRQLASHLSGLGRDYPPDDFGEPWPRPLAVEDRDDKLQALMDVSPEEFLNAVAKFPLVAPQYTFPIYSNTGFDVLGLCNVGAAQLFTGQAKNYSELLQDDVFDPLGLNSSFYGIPNSRLAAQIAVPSSNSDMADFLFPAVLDPSGGQYSSLADLTRVMQSFLSPEKNGLISPYAVREWLRPLHPWSDGFYEVGAPWEIAKVGKEARLYSKGGNLPGYHSQFGIIPQWSYGVIVLEAISQFQPAFENLLLMQTLHAYGGVWVGDDSVAVVVIEDGALYLQDLRKSSGGSKGVALWSTGRPHEFRLAIGRPELNDNPDAGCEPYWISIDLPMARGAPLDLLLWDGSELIYPSAGVRLRRLAA
ncbi:beta-lactamase/transpeptidase-like protein [Mycena galopus ATCC 62051]|nr:beta-lactamase/transpeptidase-like protein [Mycena galopus ATCC 62051]